MICRNCGAEFEPKKRGRKNSGFCSHKCSDTWRQHDIYDLMPKKYEKQCAFCGKSFQTNSEGRKYCSTKCSHDVRKTGRTVYTKKRRQKQLIENYVEPVELQSTYHNYGGVCGICGLPVPERNDPASDWGPTVDHIKPLSLGGLHQQSNCQLAHRLCNSLKLDTTDVFKINWREKLIDEPGRWNARLDALRKQLGLFGCEKEPTRITIQPSTTIRAGL